MLYKCHDPDSNTGRDRPQSYCEDHCTALNSCVAYNYLTYKTYTSSSTYMTSYICNLIPSVRNCPSGFKPIVEDGPIAATMNDLKRDSRSTLKDWVCYGKN